MKITLLTGKTYNIEQKFAFPLKIIKSARARKLTLRIDTKERMAVLTLPRYCAQKKAVEFVTHHQEWIKSSLAQIPAAKSFQNGDKISLFGQEVTISHEPSRRLGAKLENTKLIVSGEKEFINRRVKDYIKKKAAEEFGKRARRYAKKLGVKIHGITIKDTKSRWGSCSTLNNLNFSWRVALAPNYVIDYLMAHEVSHLVHHDHSPNFWQTVKSLNADYEKGEKWLKDHGKELYSYE